jgi:hypothetical protein
LGSEVFFLQCCSILAHLSLMRCSSIIRGSLQLQTCTCRFPQAELSDILSAWQMSLLRQFS